MLREQYIATIRNSVVNQLNNISIQNEDGTVTDLGEKFGKKAND